MVTEAAGTVTVRAPGKVNLALKVGPLGADGYHPLVTVFLAVSVFEQVTMSSNEPGDGITISVSGRGAGAVPTDERNIAYRAAISVAARLGMEPDLRISINKSVPVAGGMAGGSADAAATLVACHILWGSRLGVADLHGLAAGLGSDVPFALLGTTALGTGRGELLRPVPTRGEFHWALALQDAELSTPAVYRKFDDLAANAADRDNSHSTGMLLRDPLIPSDPDSPLLAEGAAVVLDQPGARTSELSEVLDRGALKADSFSEYRPKALLRALAVGDSRTLGAHLVNDLQPAALELMPSLEHTLAVARQAGAPGVIVSGSGPSVAALATDARHAHEIGSAWKRARAAAEVLVAVGPVPGATDC
ncbi:MAG: 4-(cytidine 5'-diphospho)-2-C-methyl-D-erythritol kinase [Promicromonosporaceae bacterium]|nr:4-(cytidine 5'-diphospho)-2-C-methyl-D-erythritol kinase [Promicromonosporaceae bacterium]